jgi:AraC-like DNA-binding protein
MTSTVEPPSSGRPFQIQDVDEARKYVCDVYGKVVLEPTDRAPFHWDVRRTWVGPIYIASSWFRGGAQFHTEDANDRYFLFFSRKNQGRLRAGGDIPIIPGRAAAVRSPSMLGDLRVESDYRPMTIAMGDFDLKSAFRTLTGHDPRSALCFEPSLSTVSGVGARLQRLVRFIFDELDHDDNSLRSRLVGQRCAEALMFSLLEGVPHNQMTFLTSRARAASPSYVRRAAEYLSAHAAEPIKMADLANELDVSVRSIQAGFKAFYGCPVTAFLRERRLELARERLLCATPGTTVAEIAFACGFEHVGRFSGHYRARFGEPPSATLKMSSRCMR